MKILLPGESLFTQTLSHTHAWSDHYGALRVAADYCELAADLPFNGIWQHGCFEPWMDHCPELLVYCAPESKRRQVFVARSDQRDLLSGSGYQSVDSIGLPFIYTRDLRLPRIKDSLLIMPIHTLDNIAFEEDGQIERYVIEVSRYASRFSTVLACVHPSCVKNGHWVREFTRHGIEVVSGARVNDENALYRMKALLSQVEFVTTNGFGSHFAYALSCGAKTSIFGPKPSYSVDKTLENDGGWGRNRSALIHMRSEEMVAREQSFLGDFYVPPDAGIIDIDLGNWLIGWDNKKSKKYMRDVFNWGVGVSSHHFSGQAS